MQFRILGQLEVVERDVALPLGGTKQRAVLAILILHRGELLTGERLVDELWGEHPPATAIKTLQGYVSRLRKTLGGEVLHTRGHGYVLSLAPGQLDLDRFESLAAEGGQALADGEAIGATKRLCAALDLWRGPPLSDFSYEPFAQAEIARLDEARLAALEDRIDADMALGRHRRLVAELEALVREHPLRERMRSQLMLGLYRSGRHADALQTYQSGRCALVEELGIEPSRPMRELHQAILEQDRSLDLVGGLAGPTMREARPAAVFVGRERELSELTHALEDAIGGRGRLLLLTGEPGIGKSRLGEELGNRARALGARVLVGRCWEAGGAPAYWPWVQSLRTYLREINGDQLRAHLGPDAAAIVTILPELDQLVDGQSRHFPRDPDGARFRLFHATAEFLRRASEAGPIVLLLDDVHAADTPSLLMLQFIAREVGSMHLLVVAAMRDVDPLPDEALTTMLAEVTREPGTRRIALAGLREQDVDEYVQLAASEIASPELVSALYAETEGNPLFVAETVRLLSLEGIRPGPDGAFRLAIPQSVRDVITLRLAHLSKECKRTLVLASVLGREFAVDVLARMADVSEDDLLDTLEEAMIAGVVADVPGGPGRLRFAHVLIRDTLYGSPTTVRRVRLHRAVVEVLEARYGSEPAPHLAELAHHSIAGSDFAKGFRYAWRAGDRELALLAYEEAARLYETALEALALANVSDEEARCGLLLALGEAEARAGNPPASKKVLVEAAGIAQRLELPRELARAAASYGGRIVWARAGGDAELVPLLEAGLAVLPDEDVEFRSRLLARLAGALRDEHSRDRRDALSRVALELARRTGTLSTLAYALIGRATAIVAPDTAEECLRLGTELREVAERSGDPESIVAGIIWQTMAQLYIGDACGAEVDVAEASRIAHDLRQPAQLWEVCSVQAMLALAGGRFAEAEKLIPRAFAFGEHAQPDGAIPVYRLQCYALRDFRGGLAELDQAICDLVAEYPARVVFRCVRAHLDARLGRLPEAKRALESLAANDVSALPFDVEWLYGMSLLAETSAVLGDGESAAVIYRLLVPWAALNVVTYPEAITGSVSRYLGLLATTMNRLVEAAAHFELGLVMNDRMGLWPWLARTEHDYADMLVVRNESGDRERALELIGHALTTYRGLGMKGWSQGASEFERALRAGLLAPGR